MDEVTIALDDIEQVQADAERAIGLRFGGKLMIHPRQIEPALKAFLPHEDSSSWARQVIELSNGGDAVCLNGVMIDRAVYTMILLLALWSQTISY